MPSYAPRCVKEMHHGNTSMEGRNNINLATTTLGMQPRQITCMFFKIEKHARANLRCPFTHGPACWTGVTVGLQNIFLQNQHQTVSLYSRKMLPSCRLRAINIGGSVDFEVLYFRLAIMPTPPQVGLFGLVGSPTSQITAREWMSIHLGSAMASLYVRFLPAMSAAF